VNTKTHTHIAYMTMGFLLQKEDHSFRFLEAFPVYDRGPALVVLLF